MSEIWNFREFSTPITLFAPSLTMLASWQPHRGASTYSYEILMGRVLGGKMKKYKEANEETVYIYRRCALLLQISMVEQEV